jgi:hypothetical protein
MVFQAMAGAKMMRAYFLDKAMTPIYRVYNARVQAIWKGVKWKLNDQALGGKR